MSSGYGEETHVLKVVGLNHSTVYWMDIFSHAFAIKIEIFLGKDEDKQKRSRGWPIFKKYLTRVVLYDCSSEKHGVMK